MFRVDLFLSHSRILTFCWRIRIASKPFYITFLGYRFIFSFIGILVVPFSNQTEATRF